MRPGLRPNVRTLTVALSAVVAALVLGSPAAWAVKKEKPPKTEDIINIFLGIENSQWLVGPIYYLATPDERSEYLALTSDEAADGFIREFWRQRDPEPEIFGNPAKDLFDRRVEIADRRYREGATLGRRTPRGTLFVLFGEPELISYDASRNPREPELEIWTYPKRVDEPLGGLEPNRQYFFAEKDGRTVLYQPRASRRKNLRPN